MKRFAGKVVMITGCAQGIGAATAKRFAEEGAHIVGIDLAEAALKLVMKECESLGVKALGIVRDVCEAEGARGSVARALETFGRLDVLVCCAGSYSSSVLSEVSLEDWRSILEVNLTGTFLYNQAVAPVLIRSGSGSIVNISSMAGKTSWDSSAQYSASKSAVIGLTRSVAMDLAPHGATANALCPGNTRTKLVEKVASIVGAREGLSGEKWLELRARDCPMKRIARPEEMAGIVAFLASEDSRYITGQSISADGGMVLY